MPPSKAIHMAVADSDAIYRNGLLTITKSWTDVSVLFEADDLSAFTDELGKAEDVPDVCLLDIKSACDNFELIAKLREEHPEARVLVLSRGLHEPNMARLVHLGVNGFVSKDSGPRDVYRAVSAVYSEGYFYSSFVSRSFFERARKNELVKITKREMEFLALCCTALSHKEIAHKMGISVRTIESYRDSIYSKINIKNRMELMLFALKSGIASLESQQAEV